MDSATCLPTGTVTFLFTDIEGSTHLARHLGDRWPAILAEHDGLLRATWQAHGGVEISRMGMPSSLSSPAPPTPWPRPLLPRRR
jgi:class 3 adenylate cyclase